ncbi:MAG: hypothetical protein ACK415_13150 [Thermodesulfovibrionales bacterium]
MTHLIEQYEELHKRSLELKRRLKRWYMREPASIVEIWQAKQALIEITLSLDEISETLGLEKKISYL